MLMSKKSESSLGNITIRLIIKDNTEINSQLFLNSRPEERIWIQNDFTLQFLPWTMKVLRTHPCSAWMPQVGP